jgi:hypothetical protein
MYKESLLLHLKDHSGDVVQVVENLPSKRNVPVLSKNKELRS